jgi:hypothetical protein
MAPTQVKTVEAPVPMEAMGANVTPRVDGGHESEVEPCPENVPEGAALIPRSLGDLASACTVGPL